MADDEALVGGPDRAPKRRALEDRMAAAARRQHGVVTRRQLLAAGFSASAIKRRMRAGALRALYRGVYLVFPFPLPRTREMAAVLASGAGVVSHLSAGTAWGLCPASGKEAEPVDVVGPAHGRRRRGLRLHRVEHLAQDECTVLDGIPITTPARTLLDLATVLAPRELENAVARAEREGLVAPAAVSELLSRHRGHRGAPALRAVLEAAGGPALTRSAAEAKFLALVRKAGLPAPESNVSVGRYEIDFLWRSAGIAVEVDGFRFHSSRPRFEGDRRRDAQLLAAGIAVLRLSWRQITQEPVATAVQLGQALARAGGR